MSSIPYEPKSIGGAEFVRENQTQLVTIDLVEEISALNFGNESGPCRHRTDDPRIIRVAGLRTPGNRQ